MQQLQSHKLVFVGGLHRSGKSLLFRCLCEHPQISGFQSDRWPADEGQHLQTVYAPASWFGGPGVFGFSRDVHLTESSHLVTSTNRDKLIEQWSSYWDLSKEALLETTPQNLLQTRFLQALFPNAHFLIVMRHPIAVAYATRKCSRTSLYSLIEHWLHCHELFEEDRGHLDHIHVVRYEDLVAGPEQCLQEVYRFLGLEYASTALRIKSGDNERHFRQWRRDRRRPLAGRYLNYLVAHLEARMQRFPYRIADADESSPGERCAGHGRFGWSIAWAYRGTGVLSRVAARFYKRTRKHVRNSLGLIGADHGGLD